MVYVVEERDAAYCSCIVATEERAGGIVCVPVAPKDPLQPPEATQEVAPGAAHVIALGISIIPPIGSGGGRNTVKTGICGVASGVLAEEDAVEEVEA